MLQETWYTDDYAGGINFQGYTVIQRRHARRADGNIRGGRVATLIPSGIAQKCESNTYTVQQDDTTESPAEQVFVQGRRILHFINI